jgi:hypothetical protein
MFLIFPFHLLRCVDAISYAQSLRATALQSMKWLTEYFAERAMNVSAWKRRRSVSADRPREQAQSRFGVHIWAALASTFTGSNFSAKNASAIRCCSESPGAVTTPTL